MIAVLLMQCLTLFSQPIIQFGSTNIEFGDVLIGSNQFRMTKIYNTGNEPLVIVNAISTNPNAVPTYPLVPILPGDSLDLQVNVNTSQLGNYSATITISSNSSNGQQVISVQWNVVTSVSTNSISDENILIYPNPTCSNVTITPLSFVSSIEKLEIYNASGATIWSCKELQQSGIINISNLIQGNYHLIVYTKNGIVASKSILKL